MDAWLAQQPPHIRFTPLIRELASDIVGEEKEDVYKRQKKWREKALNLECLCKKWRMNSNI